MSRGKRSIFTQKRTSQGLPKTNGPIQDKCTFDVHDPMLPERVTRFHVQPIDLGTKLTIEHIWQDTEDHADSVFTLSRSQRDILIKMLEMPAGYANQAGVLEIAKEDGYISVHDVDGVNFAFEFMNFPLNQMAAGVTLDLHLFKNSLLKSLNRLANMEQ